MQVIYDHHTFAEILPLWKQPPYTELISYNQCLDCLTIDTHYESLLADTVFQTTEKTRVALEKLVRRKIGAAMPAKAAGNKAPAKYIRWADTQTDWHTDTAARRSQPKTVSVTPYCLYT